jgi:hypothetical protein
MLRPVAKLSTAFSTVALISDRSTRHKRDMASKPTGRPRGRPRADRFADLDRWITVGAADILRSGARSPTEAIRQFTSRCWRGDSACLPILQEALASDLKKFGEIVELARLRQFLGASEISIVRRVLRRCERTAYFVSKTNCRTGRRRTVRLSRSMPPEIPAEFGFGRFIDRRKGRRSGLPSP